jgi:hypothetical protein
MPNTSYGSVAYNGQIFSVPTSYAYAPGAAVGPIVNSAGYAPLATLPGGIQTGTTTGTAGGGGRTQTHIAFGLAAMFVAGMLIYDRVHWRP